MAGYGLTAALDEVVRKEREKQLRVEYDNEEEAMNQLER